MVGLKATYARLPRRGVLFLVAGCALIATLMGAWIARRAWRPQSAVTVAQVLEQARVPPDLTDAEVASEAGSILAAAERALRMAGPSLGAPQGLAETFERTLAAYRSESADQLLALYDELGLTLEDQRRSRLIRTWPVASSMIRGRKVDWTRLRASVISKHGSGPATTNPAVFRRWAGVRGARDIDLSATPVQVVGISILVQKHDHGSGGPFWFEIGLARRPADGRWIPVAIGLSEVQERPVVMPPM